MRERKKGGRGWERKSIGETVRQGSGEKETSLTHSCNNKPPH